MTFGTQNWNLFSLATLRLVPAHARDVTVGGGDLVAIDVSSSAEFVVRLQRCWDAGAAVAPIDQRLTARHKAEMIEALAPTVVSTDSGTQPWPAGFGVDVNDRLVMTTSGTSGRPKGVVFSADAVAAAAAATSRAVGAQPDEDLWLCCLPVAHMGGFGVVSRALHTGTGLIVHDGFDADAVTAAAQHGATLTSLVATAMRRIDPRIFRRIVLGGAAVPPDRPANAVATYGLTESCGGVVYDGVPIDGVEMRIGADDEIELRGAMMMRSYRHLGPSPSGDREGADNPIGADGWLRTGDRGLITSGVLSVLGRRDDLIISGGENVWPGPIEALLQAQPWVEAVAVIGRPDPEWGQIVTAIVEPVAGQPTPTLDMVRSVVKAELPAFFAPRAIELRTLPRTAIGKVRRQNLR